MKALVLYGPGIAKIGDVPIPTPQGNWVLVKSVAVGVCGTDKAFYKGTYKLFKSPLIPGHEVVGVVVSDSPLRGRLVVSEINFSCGSCYYCRSGLYTHCPYKKTLGIDFDGGFAEYFAAPQTALHIVNGLDSITATEVEPLAAVLNAFSQYPPRPSDNIAVLGTGNLAYLATQVLLHMGLEPVVIARPDSPKTRYFVELGIRVLDTKTALSYVSEKTPEGLGFDMVFEATGDPQGLDIAIQLTRPRGVIHLKSTPGALATVNTTVAVVKEIRIIGTRCGTFKEFEKAIDLLKRGVVKPKITEVVKGIDNAVEALKKSLERHQLKVVVEI
ncbi:MAG: alcohol dehydrogenase catalytic domain-containing protein [Ignisphaera sp.]